MLKLGVVIDGKYFFTKISFKLKKEFLKIYIL